MPPLNAIKQPDGNMVVIVPSTVSIVGIVEITEATGNIPCFCSSISFLTSLTSLIKYILTSFIELYLKNL